MKYNLGSMKNEKAADYHSKCLVLRGGNEAFIQETLSSY